MTCMLFKNITFFYSNVSLLDCRFVMLHDNRKLKASNYSVLLQLIAFFPYANL